MVLEAPLREAAHSGLTLVADDRDPMQAWMVHPLDLICCVASVPARRRCHKPLFAGHPSRSTRVRR